jgi:hypothetical protein
MGKKRNKIKLGKITADSMAIKHQRDLAMPTIFEALLEILTNSDDAYESLNNNSLNYLGDVRIEYDRGGKKNPTILRVKDKAIGMSFEQMKDKLMTYHKKTSTTSRSFFGRGLRDVTALGDVRVSSIKDGLFSEVIMYQDLNVVANANNEKPTKDEIKDLGTKKHGTTIEVIIPAGSKMEYNPYVDTIIHTLPRHYALSRVLDSKHKTLNLTIVTDKKEHKIVHVEPDGELIFEKNIEIPKYKTTSKFRLYKLKNLVEENYSDAFRTTGISVFGKKTCFQKNFLDRNIDREPLAQRYYGYLECEHLDFLMKEWHDNATKNKKQSSLNETFILNPTRTEGIKRNHPFAIELFKEPIKILKKFIDEDKKDNSSNQKDEKLSKLVDEMMKDCADLLDDIDRDESGGENKGALALQEWRAIPSGLRIKVGEEKKISIYTFAQNLNKGKNLELFISDKQKQYIEIKNSNVEMTQTKNDTKKYVGVFTIIGKAEKTIEVSFRYNKQVKTQAKIDIYLDKNREFKKDIEFDKPLYNVVRDKSRTIKVFAKYPEIVNENSLELKVISNQVDQIKFKPICKFNIIKNTNYAIGEISVKGLKLESVSKLEITNGILSDVCDVLVVDKEDDEKNPFTWDIDKYDLGPNRAAWDTTNSNLLKISSKHETIRKYLGSENKPYPYSESALFRLLCVEILAEKFAEKRVDLIALNNPIEYSDVTNYKQPHEILQQANVYFEKAKVKFLEKLHKNWIKEEEIKKINS